MTKRYIPIITIVLSIWGAQAHSETLTNESIIELSKAGLGPEAIVAKIKTSANRFDLSTDKLIILRQNNLPDAVIAAMLNASANSGASSAAIGDSDSPDPKAQHASGIYLLENWNNPPIMQRMDATTPNQTKTTGILGYAFSYGIANIKIKTVMSNPSARVKAMSTHPKFYFYFDVANRGLSRGELGGMWLPGSVTSPNEFSLVKFDTSHGDREAVLGQMNITGMKTGVMDKARVSFTYGDIAPGVYEVTPDRDLVPGEYGFVYSTTSGLYGGLAGARIFDFSIQN